MKSLVTFLAVLSMLLVGSYSSIRGDFVDVLTVVLTSGLTHLIILRSDWRSLQPLVFPALCVSVGSALLACSIWSVTQMPAAEYPARFLSAGLASIGIFMPGILDFCLRLAARCGLQSLATAAVLFRNNLPWTVGAVLTGMRTRIPPWGDGRFRFLFLIAVSLAGRVPQISTDYQTASIVRSFRVQSTENTHGIRLRVSCVFIGGVVLIALVAISFPPGNSAWTTL